MMRLRPTLTESFNSLSNLESTSRSISQSKLINSNPASSQSSTHTNSHTHPEYHPPSNFNYPRRSHPNSGPLSPRITWDRNNSLDEEDPWMLMAKSYDDLAQVLDEDVALALSAGQDQLDQLFQSALHHPVRSSQTQIRSGNGNIHPKNGVERFDWRLQAPSRMGETNRPPVGSRRYNLLKNNSSGKFDLNSNGSWSINTLNQDLQTRIVSRSLPTKDLLKGTFTAAQRRKGLTLSSSTITSSSSPLELSARYAKDRTESLRASKEYREKWLEILSHERAAAEEAIQLRRQWPIGKLVQTGYAVDDLLAYWQGSSSKHFGNRVATFKLIGSQPLPWNRFRPGDNVEVESEEMRMERSGENAQEGFGETFEDVQVKVENVDGLDATTQELKIEKEVLKATVLEKGARHIKLFFEGEAQKTDLEASSSWRLYQLHNDIAEVRIDEALQSLDHDVDFLERANVPGKELVLAGSKISDVLLDMEPPMERDTSNSFDGDMRIKSWMERYARDNPLIMEGDPELGLNQSQMKAVAMMLKERVSLVQGVSIPTFSSSFFSRLTSPQFSISLLATWNRKDTNFSLNGSTPQASLSSPSSHSFNLSHERRRGQLSRRVSNRWIESRSSWSFRKGQTQSHQRDSRCSHG